MLSNWQYSDGTVHYKSDKTVKFCGFRCTTTSLITVFINVVFLHLWVYFNHLEVTDPERFLHSCKLDYFAACVLAGVPETLLRRLQSVLNAAARLVFSASHVRHVHLTFARCHS